MFSGLMWCHSFPLSEPFALAISSPGSIVDPWTACNINYARIHIARAEKQDALGAVDTQYVALVSHVCAATTKGDSPHEEMSI